MANYYLDFVGLNTFIYETSGWDISQQDPVFTDNSGLYTPVFNTQAETTTFPNEPKNVPLHQNHMGCAATVVNHNHLNYFKNFLFSHNLPNTASFFPALMLRRNGPYGYNSFKQIRVSQNPLSRRQRKENVFTFVTEPGGEIVTGKQENF